MKCSDIATCRSSTELRERGTAGMWKTMRAFIVDGAIISFFQCYQMNFVKHIHSPIDL